ncbi:Membrane-associated guanylate kinase, WW and PDZ domain-containing protein 2 [Collichthys lucidus]|uniref:Membrane-associated guanylate kinase, WW and PDZ domain-containing protein 2 n=1 Tax=Collichthys lucidus TaxID=240159 RepID=A0A4U5VTT1_COLLU|nr:Membrane-associated guanylate kinase, WW and PDZ domain-containing protein 2 [Collichthys lucidus]
MSKSLKKRKNHWTNKVHESVLCRNEEGELGLELKGGAENGQFPVIGELLPGSRAACHSGKLFQDELLLEVNDTPVAGLTTRDVHAVVKHSKDPVRLKCVKQGMHWIGIGAVSDLFKQIRNQPWPQVGPKRERGASHSFTIPEKTLG